MRLGRHRQQRPGQRPQGAGRRCGHLAVLVAGLAPAVTRRAAFVVALGTRSRATLRRSCRWPQKLRMVGLCMHVLPRTVPRPDLGALRTVGVRTTGLLRVVAVRLLPWLEPGGAHSPASIDASTSARRWSSPSTGVRHTAPVARATRRGPTEAAAT
jgi:hypothetical protein